MQMTDKTTAQVSTNAEHVERPMMVNGEEIGVDAGVYDLVEAINSASGLSTEGSCQGSEEIPGYIKLSDGRYLIITRDRRAALDMRFPPVTEGCTDD